MIINGIEKLASARAATEVTDKGAALIEAFRDIAGKVPV
jgi:predicted transcriptional regulator